MRKNTFNLQTIQDELTLSSDMKSTLNFDREKCIYKKYLNFDIFHHSPICFLNDRFESSMRPRGF